MSLRRPALEPVAAVGVLALVAVLVQLLSPSPFDADSYYHLAVARLIAKHGLLQAFPWTPFSWLADHYADKELVFHLLLLPVASLPVATAAKIGGAFFGTLLLAAIFFVLRAEKAPAPLVWTLSTLAGSALFVLRFSLLRPHLLAIALALGVTWAAARRRWTLLAALSFAYPLCYTAFHTALVLVLIVAAASLLAERRLEWRGVAACAAGLAAGLLVHPNFPEILAFWKIQNVDVLSTAWAGSAGFELGQEFGPLGLGDLVRHAPLPAVATAAALVLVARTSSRQTVPLSFALAAASFAILSLASARFVEYWAPFSCVALALAAGERLSRPAASGAVLAAFAFLLAFGRSPIEQLTKRGDDLPAPVAEALAARIPVDAQVFTCNWGLTGELMIALPERRFMVALDPVLFFKKDPGLYREWFELTHRPPPRPSQPIRERFGARYVLCERSPRWRSFIGAMEADPGARALFRSPLWYAAELPLP
ncbi:MAG: hypothetical protein QM765_52285 [Myxococcales bacterium]